MLETEINPNDELWLSEVEAPQIITDPNLFAWDDEADLIVAGLGGAGIAAANEALDQNLTVIGVDKTSGGGATAKSGVSFMRVVEHRSSLLQALKTLQRICSIT